MKMTWDVKYEVGHERIDFEHHIFLDLVCSFKNKLDQGGSKAKLLSLLREIGKYADFHFTSEENLMEDCAYPDLRHHAQLHAALLGDLHDKTGEFARDRLSGEALFDFLFHWFAFHTSKEDKELARHIASL